MQMWHNHIIGHVYRWNHGDQDGRCREGLCFLHLAPGAWDAPSTQDVDPNEPWLTLSTSETDAFKEQNTKWDRWEGVALEEDRVKIGSLATATWS